MGSFSKALHFRQITEFILINLILLANHGFVSYFFFSEEDRLQLPEGLIGAFMRRDGSGFVARLRKVMASRNSVAVAAVAPASE